VGINGALNTNYPLTVNGDQSNTGNLNVAGDIFVGATTPGYLRFRTYSGKSYIQSYDDAAGAFQPILFTRQGGSPEYMKLTTTGLDVSGDIKASGNVTAYSDVRLKENIVTLDSAIDKVMALRGVYYTRKDNPGPRQVGVIAQEVETILPEVVMTDTEGKKSVAYGNIVALLIEGMKEQQSTINGILAKLS